MKYNTENIGAKVVIIDNDVEDYSIGLEIVFTIQWDISGDRHYRATRSAYYRGADAIMFVFDKTNRESYEHLDAWVEEIKRHNTKDIVLIFLGNKCDLEPEVSMDEVQEKAIMYQVPYIEVGSELYDEVYTLFHIVTRKVLEKKLTEVKE